MTDFPDIVACVGVCVCVCGGGGGGGGGGVMLYTLYAVWAIQFYKEHIIIFLLSLYPLTDTVNNTHV